MYFVFGTVFAAPHMEGVVKQEEGGGGSLLVHLEDFTFFRIET